MAREKQIGYTPGPALRYIIEQLSDLDDRSQSAVTRRALENYFADEIEEIDQLIAQGKLVKKNGELNVVRGRFSIKAGKLVYVDE